jgi:hypothetical protein
VFDLYGTICAHTVCTIGVCTCARTKKRNKINQLYVHGVFCARTKYPLQINMIECANVHPLRGSAPLGCAHTPPIGN